MLNGCQEAIRIEESGIYNCINCSESHKYVFMADLGIKICKYFNYDKRCMVKNCLTCKNGNNYFCSKCLLEDHEVNYATGSCVKKMPKIPAVTWKDLFRLKLNSNTTLNEKDLYGFSMYIRGLTCDQINTGHAFLIKLVFSVLYVRNLRNLEEKGQETIKLKIPTICQIVDNVDEIKNEVNIVDYYCLANRTGEDEFNENDIKIEKIELDDKLNDTFLINSNFEDMISNINFDEIINKEHSSFTFDMLDEIIVFEIQNIIDQKFDNYTFNFSIYGKINKELEQDSVKTELQFIGIKNKTASCVFNIRGNKNADLQCNINLEDHKEYGVFKFKTLEFKYKETLIFLNRIKEINLLVNEKEKNEQEEETDHVKKNKIRLIIIIIIIVAAIILILFLIFIIFMRKSLLKKVKIIRSDDKIPHKKKMKNSNSINTTEESDKRQVKKNEIFFYKVKKIGV